LLLFARFDVVVHFVLVLRKRRRTIHECVALLFFAFVFALPPDVTNSYRHHNNNNKQIDEKSQLIPAAHGPTAMCSDSAPPNNFL
jgi:hypothetical protein